MISQHITLYEYPQMIFTQLIGMKQNNNCLLDYQKNPLCPLINCSKQMQSTVSIVSNWFYGQNITHTVQNKSSSHFKHTLFEMKLLMSTFSTIFFIFTVENETHSAIFHHPHHLQLVLQLKRYTYCSKWNSFHHLHWMLHLKCTHIAWHLSTLGTLGMLGTLHNVLSTADPLSW